jgi:hypothetical protein
MAISSPIKVINITKGFNSLRAGLGSVKKSAQGIKSILFNKTKVKQQAISGKKVLQNRRRENSLRKEQQDILEASGIKPTIRRTRTAIVDSSKGFLGRILDFVGTLFVGWLLYNLPTLITMTTNLITRIKTLFGALSGFIGNIFNVFGDIGNIIGSVLSNIAKLDFLDSDRKVRGAFGDLTNHFDDMGKQFEDGVKSLTTPLGKGAGEEEIPSTGTPAGGGANFGEPQYSDTGAAVGGGGGGTVSPQSVYSYLKQLGVSDTHALGILANIQGESGFTIGAKEEGNSKQGVGLFQYTYPSRKSAFLRAVPDYRTNWKGQIDFAIKSDPNTPLYLRKQFRSPEEAADDWMRNWENPDHGVYTGRRKKHNDFIKSFRSGKTQATQGSSQQAKFGQPNYSTTGSPISRKGSPVTEYITGDPNTSIGRFDKSGHGTTRNYHDHLAFKDKETTLKAYNFFKSKGFKVTEFGVSSGHANGSLHYSGRAFDIPGYQWGGSGAIGSKDYQGSAKVRSALAEFLGTPEAQISSPGSAVNVAAITPERRGATVAVMDNSQPQQPTPSGGRGGGSAPTLIPSSDGLNSFIKQNLLLDLAYT